MIEYLDRIIQQTNERFLRENGKTLQAKGSIINLTEMEHKKLCYQLKRNARTYKGFKLNIIKDGTT